MSIREAEPEEKITKATYVYRINAMVQEHNYLCAVCRENSAVIETWHGILQPCWQCQKKYKVVKLNWIDKILGRAK